MTSRALLFVLGVAVLLAALAGPARAQATGSGEGSGSAAGSDEPEPTEATESAAAPAAARPSVRVVTCGGSLADGTPPIDTKPGAFPDVVATGPTLPWNEFTVAGPLLEPAATVHDLIDPAFKKLQTASEPERTRGIAEAVAIYGYQLLAATPVTGPGGVTVQLRLAQLPVVRLVSIEIGNRGFFESLSTALLDDEVRRRVQLKPGTYLPYRPDARRCKLSEEQQRIEDYLHEEGYFEATARIAQDKVAGVGVPVHVVVNLGPAYTTGRVEVLHPSGDLDVPVAEIQNVFSHCATKLGPLCYGTARFTRTRHQADLVAVADLFHRKGYPMVRVASDYSPTGSFDRRTHTVHFRVTIDQRRLLDVQFENVDLDANGISTEDMRAQLTFNEAGSSDDVEAAASARALAAYLQTRGFFDARVTWTRERVAGPKRSAGFDLLRFRIDIGPGREVHEVTFAGVKALDEADLRDLVHTKAVGLAGTLFGTNAAATSSELADDVDRIVTAYRRAGYRDARVEVTAATVPAALDSAALTAALVSAGHGDGLYVQFGIEEGTPTQLARVELAIDGDAALCAPLLARLGELLGNPKAVQRTADTGACVATVSDLLFKEDDVQHTAETLRDWLWNHGRSRAGVDYAWQVDSPHRVVARYQIRRTEPLTLGKVVIRGNFRTRASVIAGADGELDLHEGQPLTADALARAAQRLRATGLFDSVNVLLPNLCSTPSPSCVAASSEVNAVVVVQERYDYTAQVDASGGYSSYSGAFVTAGPSMHNIFGLGIYGEGTLTYGTKLKGVDLTLRIPRWLMRRSIFGHQLFPDYLQYEATFFVRSQDTPNFGNVQTEGFSTGFTYAPPARTRTTAEGTARSLVLGVHYDFRLRGRNVDALRPSGVDSDLTQVPVSTRTGSVGVTLELDRRVDRRGGLSPLAPEAGYYLGAGAAIASRYLLGQDEFVKYYLTGTKYFPVGNNLVVRADVRYDQGVPLFGAVLLPEVERFFAGGDTTVRGYADDRLATEILQVGVPPLGNVQQLRILPAGGNIRAMGSLDAQLHVYSIFATALFTDAGLITNQWSTVGVHDVRPSVGMALVRLVTPVGTAAVEYAVPISPHLGDDPRGRFHISFAARAQF